MSDSGEITGRGSEMLEAELAAENLMFTGPARWIIAGLTLVAIGLTINQLFNLRIGGTAMLEGMYLYGLASVFLAIVFLCFRVNGRVSNVVQLHDWGLAVCSLVIGGFFFLNADSALEQGWEYASPPHVVVAAILLYLLILEATRRAGGNILFAIVLVLSLYPTVAGQLPDPLSGFTQPFTDVVPFFMISAEASFGIPMQAFGSLVIGFILFGAILQFTGGGVFFNNLALALVGHFRGGAAKVSIFASGLMGSMSGSVISNVLTTGTVSIPAMRRSGFSARFAAATEACASTGGVLMPPIMGATAFVMASWLGRPYTEIIMAAAIPSALYYFALFLQIDAYAARNGLKGLPRAELPPLGRTLREGWPYIFVFALLLYLMMVYRWETTAPFYAVVFLLVVNQLHGGARLTLGGFVNVINSVGRTLAEIVAILLGVGMIIGAFQATGLTGPLANELVHLAGESVPMLLIMGAVTSFVFGMGMTVTACYIFLAITLAPALVQAGLNELAVHFFILYWGMVSFITPPVALGAFAAATIARTNPIGVGMEATRLGIAIYMVPFFFVINPALIGQGTPFQVISSVLLCFLGLWLISSSLQGYMALVGRMRNDSLSMLARVMMGIAGFVVAAPVDGLFGLHSLEVSALALLVAALSMALMRWLKRDAMSDVA